MATFVFSPYVIVNYFKMLNLKLLCEIDIILTCAKSYTFPHANCRYPNEAKRSLGQQCGKVTFLKS